MAVILFHAARHIDKAFGAPGLVTLFQAGHAGVDLFFVLSGFIILFVHRRDIGRADRLGHYVRRRISRVLPLYWIALTLTLLMGAAGSGAAPAATAILLSAFLIPTVSEPLLGTAWTLQCEAVFSVVFSVLILNKRLGMALLAAWLGWISATAFGLGSTGMPSALCGIYGLEFFLGMAAAQWVGKVSLPRPLLVASSGCVLFAAAMVLESTGLFDGFGSAARLVYSGAAVLAVAGLCASERAGLMSAPSWLQAIGGASYSLYLFQFVFIGAAWQAWLRAGLARPPSDAACFVVLAAAAVIGGTLVARWVERPLLAAMRGRRGSPSLQ